MRRVALRAVTLAALAGLTLSAPTARAALDPSTAEADTRAILQSGDYSFCTKPDEPLSDAARDLCPLAGQIPGCTALVVLCDKPPEPEPKLSAFWENVLKKLAEAAPFVAWAFIAALIGLVAYLVVRAVRASNDDAMLDEVLVASDVTLLPDARPPAPLTDAEALLQRAAEARARGDARTALFTYLAAALRALDDRGAVRVARDRTNGEYVRTCKDAAARPVLRELVREVDTVQFGGGDATDQVVSLAEGQAKGIVRSTVAATLAIGLMLVLSACNGAGFGSRGNPAGRELLQALLVKQGAEISSLPGSLANLPMRGATGPAVILDAERVPLEPETRAHLVAWVNQGGTLVLAGSPSHWPSELWAKSLLAPTTEPSRATDAASTSTSTDSVRVRVETRDAPVKTATIDSDDDDDEPLPIKRPAPHVHHVVLSRRAAMTWPSEERAPRAIARFEDGELYGALRDFGEGKVLGLASGDLLTNLGLATPGNAAALVALLGALDKNEFSIARSEQGITPPSNPFAGLLHVGLGPALVHVALFLPLLFLAYGVRQAAPREEPPARRRAFAEHIQAVGALYSRRRAARHALAVYTKHVDDRVRAAMGRGEGAAQFLATRGGADPTFTAALYARALAAQNESDGTSRATSDALADLQRLSELYARAMSRVR